MLVRAGIHIRDRALRERARELMSTRSRVRDRVDRRRFAAVIVSELDAGADLVESLRSEPQDLVLTEVSSEDEDVLTGALADALASLPERTGMILLHPDDDPRAHAALLAAGALVVLWIGLSDAGLSEALATLIERRRDEVIAQHRATRVGASQPPPMISASAAMRELLGTAQRVARADSPVLLLGETGVGKERVAQLLHEWSPRSRGPFVAVNCAAIPGELFESELFGHERGAFTGAQRVRRGHFELAHGGTLFLDEIGDVPLPLQAKLLRALQDGSIRPLGADRELVIDVRVVAATNRDLRSEVEAGAFRRDLYYRLSVVELEIPPLRARREDIEPLVRRYVVRFAERLGRRMGEPRPEAMAALQAYAWPGNVRELVNVIERAVLLSVHDRLTLGDLPAAIAGTETPAAAMLAPSASFCAPTGPTRPLGPAAPVEPTGSALGLALPPAWLERPWKEVREQLLRAGERAYLEGLLRASGGRIGASARRAGIAERSLFEKMKRHGLRKEDFRDGES
ncbi:sigma-54-dependent Fis family transcriptional regulator [Pseudenhygromyxa sp. WMMC2535]|uniref:sigma-54 interaction domain-containing protein n=1 Tax=Pseudenhygromyxa sp. WMMC2535 TaxID=2712867 RepID=UPI001553A864|nr:sigma-54 dependent transcriptional regulator [Pseudenhygromyxa sp. WMMC2535]NVB39948.1 sigma-54-dependent Fis family transcriptional regulator [Pseudenhygromyxa sp. WMMC2535]